MAAARAVPAADPAPNWPWAAWFEKNTTVTDKKTYVHFFWNAQDQRARFEGKGKAGEPLLAEAARQLVVRLCPRTATADRMKVDVVFVAERDGYGMPKWDTLQRVAHLECSKQKLLSLGAAPSASDLRKVFDTFELF
jgi:hypothetical protein